MNSSLKGYTPGLARLLGTTPAALYERQRALVRVGLLDAGEGRGPGSGVRTTVASVSLLLIGVLASDSLTDAEIRARDIANAAPLDADRCPLTGMRTFQDALASILTMQSRSRRVVEISVSRTAARAKITYRERGAMHISEFVGSQPNEPTLRVAATLAGESLKKIADDIVAILHERFDQQERELAREGSQ
jgi:hypothetical protein